MVRQISVEELAARLAAGDKIHLLDVRHEWEHEIAALPGSQRIPLAELPSRVDEVAPHEDALVVVYCHHGVRSLSAASILESAGLPNVVSLAGGIDAWSLRVDPKVPRY